MFRRSGWLGSVLPVAALSATLVSGLFSHAADARKLIYSSAVGAKHPVHTTGVEPFFKAVEAQTGGSLTFELFAGGTIAGGKQTLSAIGNGTADMGLLADIYTPNDLPVSAMVSDLAVLGRDSRVMTGATNQTLLVDCEECKKDYLKNKVLPLASYSLTPYYFMCTNAKIVTAADVAGKKVRATGSMGQLVAGLGGVPVNVTSAEIYEALQRGQADCALGPVPWLKTYTLWEQVKWVSDSPVGTYHGTNFINMRMKTWEKLTAKERQAITSNLAHATRAMAEVYENDDHTIKAAAKEHGVQWVSVDQSFIDAVAAFRAKDLPRVAELASSRGVKNPQPIIDLFVKNVEKWTQIVNDIGPGVWNEEQWAKYEAVLTAEIFSKVKY